MKKQRGVKMMKNVKKLFAALLVTAMALSTLTACGS